MGELRDFQAGAGRHSWHASLALVLILAASGIALGADRAVASEPIGPPGGPSPPATFTASTTGAAASFTLGCPASPPGAVRVDCIGRITLSAHELHTGHSFTLVSSSSGTTNVAIGGKSYLIAPGSTATIAVVLNGLGRRLLDRFYKLTATASVTGALRDSLPVDFAYGRVTSASFVWTWRFGGPITTLLQFTVVGIPNGGSVLIGCHGGGCPFAKRSIPATTSRLSLTGQFKGARLRASTTVWFAVNAPNDVGKVALFRIRAFGAPTVHIMCLPPGVAAPRACA